jgi:hypothetical protein
MSLEESICLQMKGFKYNTLIFDVLVSAAIFNYIISYQQEGK